MRTALSSYSKSIQDGLLASISSNLLAKSTKGLVGYSIIQYERWYNTCVRITDRYRIEVVKNIFEGLVEQKVIGGCG